MNASSHTYTHPHTHTNTHSHTAPNIIEKQGSLSASSKACSAFLNHYPTNDTIIQQTQFICLLMVRSNAARQKGATTRNQKIRVHSVHISLNNGLKLFDYSAVFNCDESKRLSFCVSTKLPAYPGFSGVFQRFVVEAERDKVKGMFKTNETVVTEWTTNTFLSFRFCLCFYRYSQPSTLKVVYCANSRTKKQLGANTLP